MSSNHLQIADKTFTSRLIVGTGKYPSHQVMADAHRASGTEMVTVAVRRVNLADRSAESLLSYIDASRIFLLPNTAGCYTADEAIRTARLARELGGWEWVKLDYGIRLGIIAGVDLTVEFADHEMTLGSGRKVSNDELLSTLRFRM